MNTMSCPTVTLFPVAGVNEGSAFGVEGIVSPPGWYFFSGIVNWGNSPGNTGSGSFGTSINGSFMLPHIYYDDGPSPGNGTPQDTETVSVSGMINGCFVAASTMVAIVTTNPVPQPQARNINLPLGGPLWAVSGSIQDASMSDQHDITVNWGDGSAPTVIEDKPTNQHFDTQPPHRYLPKQIHEPLEPWIVNVSVVDDDTGTAQWQTQVPSYKFDLDNDANNDLVIDAADDPVEDDYPGKLLFVNSDDDNVNCISDLTENPVTGEDDLVEFKLAWESMPRPDVSDYAGWKLALSMAPFQTGNGKVWTTKEKADEITFDTLTPNSHWAKVWVIGTDVMPDKLFLEAIDSGGIALVLTLHTPTWLDVETDTISFDARNRGAPVNLTIYDGQNGETPVVDEDGGGVPGKGGAVTVANMNDTDDDGLIDNADNTNGVLGSQSPGGRDEVDLMKLIVEMPDNYEGGNVVLTVSPASRVMLWADPFKQTEVWEYDETTGIALLNEWNPPCGPRTMWVEIKTPSQTVADITITASYGGASDSVKATGVWSTVTAEEFDTKYWNELQGTTWRTDMDQSLQDELLIRDGTGVKQPFVAGPTSIWNVMVMRYTITPADVQELLPRVKFDITRRIESKYWQMGSGDVEPKPWYTIDTDDPDSIPDAWETFPIKREKANDDDEDDDDESATVLPDGYMFVMDSPGFINLVNPTANGYHSAWQYLNFDEFMRVDFKGLDPAGETLSGSRSSDYKPWHSRVSVEWDGAHEKWARRLIGGQNKIAPEHDELPDSPWTLP